MKTNKILFTLGTAACALTLAGCDSIRALPLNYEDPIAVLKTGDRENDIYENIFSVLYDAVAEGKNDKVHNEFLKIIAQDKFGDFWEMLEAVKSEDPSTMNAYINAHTEIFKKDTDSEGDAFKRLEAVCNYINDRINKVFYNEITSGSYTYRGVFYEDRLAWAHYSQMYNILDAALENSEGKVIGPDLKENDVTNYLTDLDNYRDYIDRAVLPSIYQDLLVEEYLLNENYVALGRAYARKVNYVSLTSDNKYINASTNLMNAFVNKYIAKGLEADFEKLADAWRGCIYNDQHEIVPLTDGSDAYKLCEEAGFTFTDGYFKETKYGILKDRYNLIETEHAEYNRFASSEAKNALDEFTGSNAYPKEIGWTMKLQDLAKEDYTVDGWYVKNGGLTELPESIRTRLFSLAVASEVDKEGVTVEDGSAEPSTYGKYVSTDYTRYIKNGANGAVRYLTPEVSENVEQNPNNIAMYVDGKNYLVQIEEAVSPSKLLDDDSVYLDGNTFGVEEVAREIAHILGTKDSYTKNALQHYIEEYDVKYHTTAIFDYFKEKYPDLFEED